MDSPQVNLFVSRIIELDNPKGKYVYLTRQPELIESLITRCLIRNDIKFQMVNGKIETKLGQIEVVDARQPSRMCGISYDQCWMNEL